MNDFYQKTSYHLKIMGGGVLTTVLGVLIFSILWFISILVEIGLSPGVDAFGFFLIFFFLFINAIIPVIFLFYLFIFILEKDRKEKIKMKHSGFVGMALGLAFVLISWFAGSFMIGHRMLWDAQLSALLIGIVPGLLVGYLAGNYCYKLVKRG